MCINSWFFEWLLDAWVLMLQKCFWCGKFLTRHNLNSICHFKTDSLKYRFLIYRQVLQLTNRWSSGTEYVKSIPYDNGRRHTITLGIQCETLFRYIMIVVDFLQYLHDSFSDSPQFVRFAFIIHFVVWTVIIKSV